MPTLYGSDNLNPRLCVAAARHLQAPVRYQAAAPLAPGQAETFARLNPNLHVPILQMDDGSTLWETDAIVCRLARLAGRGDFFPEGELLPELLRWLGWSAMHWGVACSGAILPFAAEVGLDLSAWPAILRWAVQLEALSAWREPMAGG